MRSMAVQLIRFAIPLTPKPTSQRLSEHCGAGVDREATPFLGLVLDDRHREAEARIDDEQALRVGVEPRVRCEPFVPESVQVVVVRADVQPVLRAGAARSAKRAR